MNLMKSHTYIPGKDSIEPAFPVQNISILFGTDNKFLPHIMTAINSVIMNSNPHYNYDILIFTELIPEERKNIVLAWAQQYSNISIRFLDISGVANDLNLHQSPVSKEISIATYYRLLAPILLPRYKKIVYLDGDLICLGDIAELYEIELGATGLGACRDSWICQQIEVDLDFAAYVKNVLELGNDDIYFNAGVLLLNLEWMREQNLLERMLGKLVAGDIYYYKDQDVLNWACKDMLTLLPDKWNRLKGIEPEIAREERGILHFIGKTKPWHEPGRNNNDECYWPYVFNNPFWKELRPSTRRKAFLSCLVFALKEMENRARLFFCSASKKNKLHSRIASLALRRKKTQKLFLQICFGKENFS